MSVSRIPVSGCGLAMMISNGWQERIERLTFMTRCAANITAPVSRHLMRPKGD
jgi:hypothetical protein